VKWDDVMITEQWLIEKHR